MLPAFSIVNPVATLIAGFKSVQYFCTYLNHAIKVATKFTISGGKD
jgi:hypothetical protein